MYCAEDLKRTIFYSLTTHKDDEDIESDSLNIRDLGYVLYSMYSKGDHVSYLS